MEPGAIQTPLPWSWAQGVDGPMSWFELERFVDDVESDRALQRVLKHCRSRKEPICLQVYRRPDGAEELELGFR